MLVRGSAGVRGPSVRTPCPPCLCGGDWQFTRPAGSSPAGPWWRGTVANRPSSAPRGALTMEVRRSSSPKRRRIRSAKADPEPAHRGEGNIHRSVVTVIADGMERNGSVDDPGRSRPPPGEAERRGVRGKCRIVEIRSAWPPGAGTAKTGWRPGGAGARHRRSPRSGGRDTGWISTSV